MKCENEGCKKDASIECYLPSYEEGEEDLVEHLCNEHAAESGYCIMCGQFWAGVTSYDFSPVKGVCENCLTEFGAPENGEDDFYFYPDEEGF